MPSFRQCALILCAGFSIAAAGANTSSVPAKPLGVPVSGPVRAQHLTVELLPLEGSIQPGGSATIGLHFTLDRGWHVYWVNAWRLRGAAKYQMDATPGITAGQCSFPAPAGCRLGR